MAILQIVTYPDKLLRQTSKPIENIDGEIQKLIDNMAETMYKAPGIGLAGIQVGIDLQVILYDVAQNDGKHDLQVLINPEIIESEGSMKSENEGCLSLPDLRTDVKRAHSILVQGFDREGKPVRFEASEFPALVIQHEIDHLKGTLLLDRMSSLKRELYKRKIKKKIKQNESAV
jgi:peptide deformylase